MKFCAYCGKEIMNEAVICVHCGCPVSDYQQQIYNKDDREDALNTLESKAKCSITFWKILGIIQICLGAMWVCVSFVLLFSVIWAYAELGEIFIVGYLPLFGAIMFLAVGLSNFMCAKKSAKFWESIKKKPVGIIEHYEPISSIIGYMIANIFFGFIFGIIGSILDISVRNYVMSNRRIFKEIEKQYAEKTTI